MTAEPTCTATGTKTRSCACGETETEELAIEHHFGEWTVTTAATCMAVGEESRTCACGETETREIEKDATAHSFGAWALTTASSCTVKGEESRTCACGAKETRDAALNPTAHSFGAWTVTTAASCMAGGEEGRTCACGAKETRATDKNASAHNFGAWKEITPATCKSAGEEKRTCACGAKETREIAVNANAHVYGAPNQMVAPTCVAPGIAVQTCSICGTSKTDVVPIDVTAHAMPTTWESDETHHWSTCTNAGCGEQVKAEHSYDAEDSCTACERHRDSGLVFEVFEDWFGSKCAIVSRYVGSASSVKIPSKYMGFPVTNIADSAFEGCTSLQAVSISNSIEYIGDCAFMGCTGLESVTLPDSVYKLGDRAFFGCTSLKSIYIPGGAWYGEALLANCPALESVALPYRVDYYYHFGVVFGMEETVPQNLRTVVLTGGTSIGYKAFRNCSGIQSITIPSSITHIYCGAFNNSGISYMDFEVKDGWYLHSKDDTTYEEYDTLFDASDFADPETAARTMRAARWGDPIYWYRK